MKATSLSLIGRALISALVLFTVAACGAIAAPATFPTPTLVLPTRVPILNTAAPNAPVAPSAAPNQPTRVADLPTAAPTVRRPVLTPTVTLIPTKAPPSATPLPSATPVPTTDPAAERGKVLFAQGIGDNAVPTCISCHYVDKDEPFTGPSQKGIANRAGKRVAGQTAEQYLRNSILNPNAFIVPNEGKSVYGVAGVSLMYQDYAKHLSADQVNDLVAYLLTLK